MINVDTPQLNTVARHLGEQPVMDFLILELAELCGFFNVKYAMTDAQIITTAELIFQEYPLYNLNDIRLFFRKIKTGDFGAVMHALDGGIILGWLKEYESQRTEKIIEINDRKESKVNQDFENNGEPFKVVASALGAINKMPAFNFKEHERKVELMQRYFKIRKEQGRGKDDKIEWNGKEVTLDEFTQIELTSNQL